MQITETLRSSVLYHWCLDHLKDLHICRLDVFKLNFVAEKTLDTWESKLLQDVTEGKCDCVKITVGNLGERPKTRKEWIRKEQAWKTGENGEKKRLIWSKPVDFWSSSLPHHCSTSCFIKNPVPNCFLCNPVL